MPVIQSARNALVKQAAGLRAAHTRRKAGLLLVEGPKAIADALAAGARFEHALVREGLEHAVLDALRESHVKAYEVASAVLDGVAATESSQGVVAVAREPEGDLRAIVEAPGAAPLAVLDGIQDPGNLGTIVRTAAALGFRGAALVEGTTDPFAPKVVRATAGTLFRFPLAPYDAGLIAERFHLVAATEGGDPPEVAFARAKGRPIALAVGNEGSGVSREVLARAAGHVWVPLEFGVESLNVASAFAILAYAATRARGR